MINIKNYEQKYLKYKLKYLNKKNNLIGGGDFEDIKVDTNTIIFYNDTDITKIPIVDAYVSASSTTELNIDMWEGGAKAIRDFVGMKYLPNYNLLAQDWEKHGQLVEVGGARIVSDDKDVPFLFSDKFYIIHAGLPQSSIGDTDFQSNNLFWAYNHIFFIIHASYEHFHKEIQSVVIMPLGIGVDGIHPTIAATELFAAIQKYRNYITNLKIIIPLFDTNYRSSDFIFWNTLNNLFIELNTKEKSNPYAISRPIEPVQKRYVTQETNPIFDLLYPKTSFGVHSASSTQKSFVPSMVLPSMEPLAPSGVKASPPKAERPLAPPMVKPSVEPLSEVVVSYPPGGGNFQVILHK